MYGKEVTIQLGFAFNPNVITGDLNLSNQPPAK
ncbi:hypothetical protein BC643_1013 [Mangrovibacterium diazotrophicum]|uniref:Uncharacterized protein n=1 Tax=Mangrovibacterium diazotrophicum TaxID=1261403 RepID=A0A419W5D5_9BACT|nr:hypothetical protein BC643_1013 [Mangrovibacterium diazotrophicum]